MQSSVGDKFKQLRTSITVVTEHHPQGAVAPIWSPCMHKTTAVAVGSMLSIVSPVGRGEERWDRCGCLDEQEFAVVVVDAGR